MCPCVVWLTNQQLESLVAFLPVNPLFSPLRNQARQKLAMLDKGQFSQILVDVLNECLYRQKRSMETGGRDLTSWVCHVSSVAVDHLIPQQVIATMADPSPLEAQMPK
jgi:hypothetical protein